MTTITELWTNREDYRETRVVSREAPDLEDGEVLMKIEKFGLTSNNVSYAVSGRCDRLLGFLSGRGQLGKGSCMGLRRGHRKPQR